MHYVDQSLRVPEETAKLAKSIFENENPYLAMRDEIGLLYPDSEFKELFSHAGRRAESPGNLALVLVMQYMEGLTDQQAATAVKARIDWKYALGLRLADRGFHHTVLSRFRSRLLAGGRETTLLESMLARFEEMGLMQSGGKQRTDSTHILGAIRTVNRLELIGETMRQALEALAQEAGEWLLSVVGPDWFDRYGPRVEEYRLPGQKVERQALAQQIGADGVQLLNAVYAPRAPAGLQRLAEVAVLRQVWVQQYYLEDELLRWRSEEELPPAKRRINSPYDLEVRYGRKRNMTWTGYKVHLTETCDQERPHLITNVITTNATATDDQLLPAVQQALIAQERKPKEHLVDAGYITVDHLVRSEAEYGIELVGPVRPDTSWQARQADAFDSSHFHVDWEAQRVRCPRDKLSTSWTPALDRAGNEIIRVRFSRQTCASCSERHRCTRAQTRGRCLYLRPQTQHEALQQARQQQKIDEFRLRYQKRAGIEGTISQGVRSFHLRRTRFIGLAKTHLHHILVAAAMNLTRSIAWLRGDQRAQTRTSSFMALAVST